jgi:hypothetical protein
MLPARNRENTCAAHFWSLDLDSVYPPPNVCWTALMFIMRRRIRKAVRSSFNVWPNSLESSVSPRSWRNNMQAPITCHHSIYVTSQAKLGAEKTQHELGKSMGMKYDGITTLQATQVHERLRVISI